MTNNVKLIEFLDDFVIEKCKKILHSTTPINISKNLKIYNLENKVSTVFYLNKYIMTIDWKIIN